ncbi:hypothetical protein D9M68_769040 [compost metagenome]
MNIPNMSRAGGSDTHHAIASSYAGPCRALNRLFLATALACVPPCAYGANDLSVSQARADGWEKSSAQRSVNRLAAVRDVRVWPILLKK